MAIFKCKMCGGDLDVQEGMTVCECEYCGTKQTVPSMDNEKKINLFNRANRLRMNSEFDKAAGVYESIVAEFPEESEAYWGLCLCKYGIEYVDDPATAKKIPTCHRTSYDSIFQDSNFDLACEYADSIAHQIYRAEAKEIDRLQKEILNIAKNEQPFDVFICYKESDDNGQRTVDSELAHDIYDVLTEKGYKVFYARITLKAKLGQDYEPYIFSALNSAKVMLAIGTKYEYYNAVWVKNEWSRYLALMSKDNGKTLIPCYRDIDAYDMPQEFKHLQGQDLSSPRAFQNLVNAIEMIISPKVPMPRTIAGDSNNTDPLIQRIHIFLENNQWDKADEYCEKVLDLEPKCSEAYLLKTLVEFRVASIDELIELRKDFSENTNFLSALKFASSEMREFLSEKSDKNKQAIFENELLLCKNQLAEVTTAEELCAVIDKLNKISPFIDCEEVLLIVQDKIKSFYDEALAKSNLFEDFAGIHQAILIFDQLNNYLDSGSRAQELADMLEKIHAENLKKAITARTKAEFVKAREILEEMNKYKSYGRELDIIDDLHKTYQTAKECSQSSLMKNVSKGIALYERLANYIDFTKEINYCKERMESEYIRISNLALSNELHDVDEAVLGLKDLGNYKSSVRILEYANLKTPLLVELSGLGIIHFSRKKNEIMQQLEVFNNQIKSLIN